MCDCVADNGRGKSSGWRLEAGGGRVGACESVAGSLACSLVALVNIGPVDDVEEGLDVVGTQVLVLEVVGVLPHVQTKQGHQACGNQGLEGPGLLHSHRRRGTKLKEVLGCPVWECSTPLKLKETLLKPLR